MVKTAVLAWSVALEQYLKDKEASGIGIGIGRSDLFRRPLRFRGITDMLSMSRDVTRDGEKPSSSRYSSVARLITMSKLCISVLATEQNSKLCNLRSKVDILEVRSPDQKSYKRF